MTTNDEYLKTVERLEPDICCIDTGAGLASIAISLKRIADALEKLTNPTELLQQVAQHPMNCYGEGFADAIQNGIVRGQRGIATYEN